MFVVSPLLSTLPLPSLQALLYQQEQEIARQAGSKNSWLKCFISCSFAKKKVSEHSHSRGIVKTSGIEFATIGLRPQAAAFEKLVDHELNVLGHPGYFSIA